MKQEIFWAAGLSLVVATANVPANANVLANANVPTNISAPASAHETVSYQLFKKGRKSAAKKKRSGQTASRSSSRAMNSGATYRSCAAARAAGAAPIRQGQAGYGRHLDRDGDGIACEK